MRYFPIVVRTKHRAAKTTETLVRSSALSGMRDLRVDSRNQRHQPQQRTPHRQDVKKMIFGVYADYFLFLVSRHNQPAQNRPTVAGSRYLATAWRECLRPSKVLIGVCS